MAEKNEIAWVFDALVGFLQSSFWSTSIQNFIEEKSLIFEPDTIDSKEYREIHQDYKNFVNLLLDCYIEDMGITPDQFEQACSLIKNSRVAMKFQQGLFEQIWAANEFEVFKRMMIQKNLELQLQSLKIIEQKYGLTPASLTHGTDEPYNNKTSTEVENGSITTKIGGAGDDKSGAKVVAEEELPRVEESSSSSSPGTARESPTRPAELAEEAESEAIAEEPEAEEEAAVDEPGSDGPTPSHSCDASDAKAEEDVRHRQLYLNAQRDKLLALKRKAARSQKLGRERPPRPSSARIVAEATVDAEQESLVSRQRVMDASILRVRRALAERLKAEVVDK